MDKQLFQEARGLIKDARSILIITHEKPDGDAIASLVAMKQLIELESDATVVVVCKDKVPKAFVFLHDASTISHDFIAADIDLIITLDCGDLKRTGFSTRLVRMHHKNIPWINVDHHPKNDIHKLATCNVVDDTYASTTQLLYQWSKHARISLDTEFATAIYTGLYTDTGSFQHPVTTPEVLEIAALMLAKGARVKLVRTHLQSARPVAMLKLWGIALERAQLTKWGIVVSAISQADITFAGASEEDLAGIVNMLEHVHSARGAMLLAEAETGVIKGSLRSNHSKIDVSKIAQLFGGGGHARAAGFVIEGTLRLDKGSWRVV